MNAIRIYGEPGRVLSVTLADVLRCMSGVGGSRRWSILWLEMMGNIGTSVLDYENLVTQSRGGLVIEWDELNALATRVSQTIEILLIGDVDPSKLKRYDTREEMLSSCEYVIELIDSTYWLVCSSDSAVLTAMRNCFVGSIDSTELDGIVEGSV